jgi:uncharacterized membrane protein (DUF373 family)
MPGGTLIALAANEIVMTGPIDRSLFAGGAVQAALSICPTHVTEGCALIAKGHMGVRKEAEMKLKEEFALARSGWNLMTFYQKFEHSVILLLTALISVVVALAVWNLTVKIVSSVFTTGFDPTDYAVFQSLFGMVFTVIIALEFKRSLLVVTERKHGIVQVRTVILIALLAVVRKLMIIDLLDATQLFAFSGVIVALGSVFWLVRDQDRRERVYRA